PAATARSRAAATVGAPAPPKPKMARARRWARGPAAVVCRTRCTTRARPPTMRRDAAYPVVVRLPRVPRAGNTAVAPPEPRAIVHGCASPPPRRRRRGARRVTGDDDLRQRRAAVEVTIADAAGRAGRDPRAVRVVAVTKTFP